MQEYISNRFGQIEHFFYRNLKMLWIVNQNAFSVDLNVGRPFEIYWLPAVTGGSSGMAAGFGKLSTQKKTPKLYDTTKYT